MLDSGSVVNNNEFIYNNDDVYVQTLQYEDLGIDEMVFAGFRVAGTGLIITLLVLGILSILRQ